MIKITTHGSYNNTIKHLEKLKRGDMFQGLEQLAQQGVDALSSATPRDTGKTAESWHYEIVRKPDRVEIHWLNTNTNNGSNVAILLQYGHGTGTGGYVVGYDYINPAMRPIFDKIANEVWQKVTSS